MITYPPMSTLTPEQILELFASQLDRFDKRYTSHLEKIESKLDRIVELTTSVATLQEKTVTHQNELTELKSAIKLLSSNTDDSFRRMHSRVDEAIKIMAETDARFDDKLEDLEKSCHSERKVVDHKVHEVHAELKKYIHIGIGMWIAASLLVTFIQWLGMSYIDNIRNESSGQKAAVIELQKKFHEHNQKQLLQEQLHP